MDERPVIEETLKMSCSWCCAPW